MAGVVTALFGLTTAMLTALTISQKQVVSVLQDTCKTCQAEKTTCITENKSTVDKSYALVGVITEMKTVVAKIVDNQQVMIDRLAAAERRIQDLKPQRGS